MSTPAEPPESTLAAVLAEHRLHDRRSDPRFPWCICGWAPERGGSGNERIYYAHLNHVAAAILAATPTAAHVEADEVALLAPWPCCEHCADDSLHDESLHNNHDLPCQACLLDRLAIKPLATHVAELEAALAAAEARLRAPQPAPEEPFGWTVKDGAEFVGPCGHVIRVTDDRMVLAALVAKAEQHAASCTQPTPGGEQ